MSDLTIRDAVPSDHAAVAALLGELGYPTPAQALPERMARFCADGRGRVLVCADGRGQVLGCAAIERTDPIYDAHPVLHIGAFVVAAAARRMGVGRRLLAHIDELAAELGCGRLVVTSAERRADAHAFYLAAGWQLTGRRFGKERAP